MPLKFTRHSPPELLEELRNLYRKIDPLVRGAVVQAGTPGGGGTPPGIGQPGTVLAWALLAEWSGTPPASGTTKIWEVATVPGPYTHLEVDVAVMQASGVDVSIEWRIRGTEGHWYWDPSEGYPQWRNTGQPPRIYTVVDFPYAVGRYRLEPVYDYPPHDGDLAFTPITPDEEEDTLKAEATILVGPNPSLTFCYKAWFIGRYVLREGGPDPLSCPLV